MQVNVSPTGATALLLANAAGLVAGGFAALYLWTIVPWSSTGPDAAVAAVCMAAAVIAMCQRRGRWFAGFLLGIGLGFAFLAVVPLGLGDMT